MTNQTLDRNTQIMAWRAAQRAANRKLALAVNHDWRNRNRALCLAHYMEERKRAKRKAKAATAMTRAEAISIASDYGWWLAGVDGK
jgi:hypothetical protein